MSISLLLAPSIGNARAQARAELLRQALSTALGEETSIHMAASYDELTLRALESSADLIWAPPSLCARLDGTARAMFRCVRRGRGTYRSAIVVRRGEVRTLAGLVGMRASWVDPLSLGGYLLAVDYLRQEGYRAAETFTEQNFVGSYPEALAQVVNEAADVTAVTVPDGSETSIAESIERYGGTLRSERLVSIAVTSETPNDALVFSRSLSESRTADLIGMAFGTAEHPKTPSALCLALEADGFETAESEDYRPVKRLLEGRSRLTEFPPTA